MKKHIINFKNTSTLLEKHVEDFQDFLIPIFEGHDITSISEMRKMIEDNVINKYKSDAIDIHEDSLYAIVQCGKSFHIYFLGMDHFLYYSDDKEILEMGGFMESVAHKSGIYGTIYDDGDYPILKALTGEVLPNDEILYTYKDLTATVWKACEILTVDNLTTILTNGINIDFSNLDLSLDIIRKLSNDDIVDITGSRIHELMMGDIIAGYELNINPRDTKLELVLDNGRDIKYPFLRMWIHNKPRFDYKITTNEYCYCLIK